ncbi:hypothetical protein [Streptomyces virginiae]|uniref:hypothetical protein n=1 Tax=Streptomyces virginiae TaxID=1961 RepID=UPI0035D5DE05
MSLSVAARILLILSVILSAVIVGLVAGMLARHEGLRVSSCVTRGGVAFAATCTLLLLLLTAMGVVS